MSVRGYDHGIRNREVRREALSRRKLVVGKRECGRERGYDLNHFLKNLLTYFGGHVGEDKPNSEEKKLGSGLINITKT